MVQILEKFSETIIKTVELQVDEHIQCEEAVKQKAIQ